MKKIMFVALMLATAFAAKAQNEKFGKPSKEEWELKSVSYAPDADAVVLFKSVDLTYQLTGSFSAMGSGGEGSLDDSGYATTGINKYVSPDGTSMIYDVKVRTKILKDSGAGYSSLDIVSFNDKEDMNNRDEFYEFKATVFSNVDGKVKKRKVGASAIKDERIDDHYMIRHVRIDGVQAGDIVEYQYRLFSNRITYIFDTQMQESIPMLYARCKLDIPHFLQFNINKPEIRNVVASVALGNILMPSPNQDMQAPRKVVTNVYTIEARDMPAYEGIIDQQKITYGKVFSVRTELKDKRYDVHPDLAGPVRHLIIGK